MPGLAFGGSPIADWPNAKQHATPRQSRTDQCHTDFPFLQFIPTLREYGRRAACAAIPITIYIETMMVHRDLCFAAHGFKHQQVCLVADERYRRIFDALLWAQFAQQRESLSDRERLHRWPILIKEAAGWNDHFLPSIGVTVQSGL